jgi:LytS/YehU family sensor histidine kinase
VAVTWGSGLLAAAVAAMWLIVWLITRELPAHPLDAGWTVLAGVGLSTLVILGYPSALRGPRHLLPWGPARPRPAPRPPAFAAVKPSMPLRSGLTADAAHRAVLLLRPLLGADSVAITDLEHVLAFIGPGAHHHGPGSNVLTEATKRALSTGRTVVVRSPWELGCPQSGCPLRSAVVAPLRSGKRVIGTLKVYRLDTSPPRRDHVESIAGILSLQLELAELDRERQLAADAKLDALRAQINPHFLFNTLNTIASKARTDPEEARQLLLRLSDFFRYSIRQHGHFADFGEEYFFVRTYLALEQARYGDRLAVRYDVDPQVLGVQVPVLTIQPLVENAVKHGLADKVGGGCVTLRARVDPLARTTTIQVRDDGVGMEEDQVAKALEGIGTDEGGIGLRNISERLAMLFGQRCALDIRSKPGEGTTVDLRIPLR